VGATIKYPDGTSLLSSALTLAEIGAILQPLTIEMLGETDNPLSSPVRLEWATTGQPFQEITDDICYLRAVPKDDPYNRIRDRFNWPGGVGWGDKGFGTPPWGGTDNPLLITEQYNYTRVWEIRWCFYGPNSTDLARALRSALYQDFFTNALSLSQLFPVPDFSEPVRAPELFDGQWFERVDFSAEFYEFVTEAINRGTVKSVEVQIIEPLGTVADFIEVGS
jgi:hypothetical protein